MILENFETFFANTKLSFEIAWKIDSRFWQQTTISNSNPKTISI